MQSKMQTSRISDVHCVNKCKKKRYIKSQLRPYPTLSALCSVNTQWVGQLILHFVLHKMLTVQFRFNWMNGGGFSCCVTFRHQMEIHTNQTTTKTQTD